ncbi:MAG: 1-pyrroline-5-carboxylate dehydrogenase, partial [Longimicrobiales bacterium]
MNGAFRVPSPDNEPVRPHAPGDPERDSLKSVLNEVATGEVEIPLIIGGEEIHTGTLKDVIMPHRHGHVLARCHRAGPAEIQRAVDASQEAFGEWSAT